MDIPLDELYKVGTKGIFAMETKELSESTVKTYTSDYNQYVRYCEASKFEVVSTDTILKFLTDVRMGYPKGTKKKKSILRMKVRGIEYTGNITIDKPKVDEFFKSIDDSHLTPAS